MFAFIVRRLLQAIPTVIVVTIIVFIILSIAPGDAALLKVGFKRGSADPSVIKALRAKMGLDKPAYLRYLIFLADLCQGNLGYSFMTEESIIDMLKERLPASLKLISFALLIAVIGGVGLGLTAALHQGSVFDLACMGGAIMGVSMPNFWFGLLLMYFIGALLRLLPTSGYGGGRLAYVIMPAITLGLPYMALLARLSRASVLDVINKDYIRTARAKGLSEWSVRWKHLFRNAMVPIVTIIGLNIGSMLANIVVVEQIFDWPGIGSLMVRSVFNRDVPALQGVILIVVLTYITANLTVDILYTYIDPRVHYE